MNTTEQPFWNNLVDMIIIKNNHLTLQSPPFIVDICRDLELVSSLARAHNSESLFESNVCNIFCRGLSCCPIFWGVCYSRVSARPELTVPANVTPPLITVPSPPYTVSHSVSWSVTQSVSQPVCQSGNQSASQWLFQLSPPVSCFTLVRHLLRYSISQSSCQLFDQSFPQSVSQSVKQSVSNSVTQSVSKLDSYSQ